MTPGPTRLVHPGCDKPHSRTPPVPADHHTCMSAGALSQSRPRRRTWRPLPWVRAAMHQQPRPGGRMPATLQPVLVTPSMPPLLVFLSGAARRRGDLARARGRPGVLRRPADRQRGTRRGGGRGRPHRRPAADPAQGERRRSGGRRRGWPAQARGGHGRAAARRAERHAIGPARRPHPGP